MRKVELPRHAQRVLDAARGADDPTPVERARADAAARSALAAIGVKNLPPLAIAPDVRAVAQSGAAPVQRAGSRLIVQLGAGAVGSSIALVLLVHGLSRTTPAPVEPPARPSAAASQVTTDQPAIVAPAVSSSTGVQPTGESKITQASAGDRSAHSRSSTARAGDDALQAEVALISKASQLLQEQRFGDAARVLREHDRRFRHGALRLEREALFTLLLCRTGPSERARRESERFLRTAPDSVLAERIRAACVRDVEVAP